MSHLTDKDRETVRASLSQNLGYAVHPVFVETFTAHVEAIVAPYAEALARVEALAAEWEMDLDTGSIRDSNARYCWSTAARELRAALAPAPTETRCRHCGKPPEADGDHSCPCPYTDAECKIHPLIVATPWPADEPLGEPPPWTPALTETEEGR